MCRFQWLNYPDMDTSICHKKKDKIETPNLSKKVDVSCSKETLQHFWMAIARR